MNRLFIFNIDRVISFLRLGSKHFLPDFRSDVGKYNKAIQHTLVTVCNKSPLGGGGNYLPTTEKKNSHKDNNKH